MGGVNKGQKNSRWGSRRSSAFSRKGEEESCTGLGQKSGWNQWAPPRLLLPNPPYNLPTLQSGETGEGGTPNAGKRGRRVVALGLACKEAVWTLCRIGDSFLCRAQGTPDRLAGGSGCLGAAVVLQGNEKASPHQPPSPCANNSRQET